MNITNINSDRFFSGRMRGPPEPEEVAVLYPVRHVVACFKGPCLHQIFHKDVLRLRFFFQKFVFILKIF